MKRYTIKAVVIILVTLNILLLYENSQQQKKIKDLNNRIVNISNYLNRVTVSSQFRKKNIRVIHPDVNLPGDDELLLFVFFTVRGCRSCVITEVRILNKFYKKYKEHTKIFLLSYDETYLKRLYDASFVYQTINPGKSILNTKKDFKNPIALMVDANGEVQVIQVAKKGKPEVRKQFYKQMASLFQSLE